MTKAEADITEAAKRFAMLRPYLDGDAPLTKVAAVAGISLRTARRWVARVRDSGLLPLSASPAQIPANADLPPIWSR